MESKEAQDRLVVALLLWSRENGFGQHQALKVARASIPRESKEFVDLVVELLDGEALVSTDRSLDDEGERYVWTMKLTAKGLRVSEGILSQNPEYGELPSVVPASDRYVTIHDNTRRAIAADLEELEHAVAGDNEAAEEDRLIALSEMAVFEETLVQPRISTELVDRFVNSVLAWITATFSGATLKAVAGKIVEALLKLLT